MAEDIKKMPVGMGLPEMPEKIVIATKKVVIDWKRICFILLGLVVFFAFYLIPGLPDAVDPGGKVFKLPWAGKMAIGLFLMAGIWWVFEVMPIGVTAIAIGLFQVLFFIRTPKEALGDFLAGQTHQVLIRLDHLRFVESLWGQFLDSARIRITFQIFCMNKRSV